MRKVKTHGLQLIVHFGSLLPIALLIWDFTQGRLSANPIEQITIRTGRYALVLLILTLSCTPISDLLGLRQVLPLRRPLGLYAFMYTSLHIPSFIGLDYGFNFNLIGEDLAEKRYLLAGFLSFLALLPIAITSTRGWQNRLGKNWAYLQWLIYPATVLAVAHFLFEVKANLREPMIYTAVMLLLFMVRIPVVRKIIIKAGSQVNKKRYWN